MRNKIFALLLGLAATAVVIAPATPAQAVLNLYRVSAQSAHDAVSPKSATVSCNAGDQMLSVGGRINDGQGDVLLTRAFSDNAMTVATAWGIEAIATANPWDVEVFAVCAPAGTVANLTLQQTTVGPNPNDKAALASCPAGTIVYGGGFKLEDAFGAVAIDELRFDPGLGWAMAVSYNYAAVGNYSLTGQAFCGTPPALFSLETWDSANNTISPKTETTNNCPAGTNASGAGGAITGGLGTVGLATVMPLLPIQLQNAEATGREIGTTGNNWEIEVQAVCVG